MPISNSTAIDKIFTTVCRDLDPPVFKSLNAKTAVTALVNGLTASKTPEELNAALFEQLPKSLQTAQNRAELASCVENILAAIPRQADKQRGFTYEFSNRNTSHAIDLGFKGVAFASEDNDAPLQSRLKLLPVDAKLKVDETRARAGVKVCAIELGINLTPDTKVTLEGLCGAAEAGLNPGGILMLLKKGRIDRDLGVLRKSFSFAALTAATKFSGENGCHYEASAKIGVGSIGPEIRVTEGAVEAYQGTGTLGLGMGIEKTCPLSK